MNRQSAFPAPQPVARPTAPGPDATNPALEEALSAVESRLAGLADALQQRDLNGIDTLSAELHQALARAVDHFSKAARSGPIPMPLRRRLASTSGHVAAQRESFARATAALDRAIDVLLPQREQPKMYGANGTYGRGSLGASIQA